MKAAIIPIVAMLSAGLPAAAQDAAPEVAPEPAQAAATPALSTIIAGLEADGYRVTDVDVDRDAIEVEAVAADGRPVELRLDPATGEVLSETDDD